MAEQLPPEEITLGPFPLGMNNKQKDSRLPAGAARNIVNADIDVQGNVSRRKGSTKVYNGLGVKGGFDCPSGEYFLEGNTIRKLNADDTSTVLFTGLTGTGCAWDYFNGIVYFSDGVVTKKIIDDVVYPWGLSVPATPILSTYAGTYDPGIYKAAYVWVDANGLESGASPIATITLTSTSGIVFNNLPGLVPGAVSLRIYLTMPNGKTFFHIGDTVADSYSLLAGTYDDGNVLDMLFVSPPPAGNIIRHYNGRMYISDGKVTWYSDPYSFDHFRYAESFLQFPYETTIMEPVDTGIFFANDKETSFYSGNPEDGFNVIEKFDYGGIYGTGRKVPNSSDVMWMSTRGFVRGTATGELRNVQEENVATEKGTTGASLVREQDGIRQIIGSINDPTTSNLAATSFIEAEIIRRS